MGHTPEGPRRAIDPPSRRRVLRAAAWSVPVVTLVATAPAYAVSGTTLTFSSATYTGVACGTIDGVVVRAIDGTTPRAGMSVVLQLAGGYSFDGGAVTATVVTGADGSAPSGTVHVPAPGTTGSIAASAAGATSGTATLTSFDARLLTSPRGLVDATAIPAGAVPVALDLFFANGVLVRSGAGTVATGVVATGALSASPAQDGSFLLPLRRTDGSAAVYDTSTGAVTAAAGVPANATPIAADLFLAGTSLVRAGAVVATDVAVTGQLVEHEQGQGPTGHFFLPYRATDGTPRLLRVPDDDTRTVFEYGTASGPPSGAQPIADDLFFAAGAVYRASWDGDSPYGAGVVASGIAAWGTLTPNPYYAGERLLPVRLASGAAAVFEVSGNTVRPVTAVPAGATPLGADLFLSGTTVYQDAVGAVATLVARTGQPAPATPSSSSVVVPLTSSTATC